MNQENQTPVMEKKIKPNYRNRALALFKDLNGNPFKLTKGQEEIVRLVHDPTILRVAIKATTQYGKSDTTSMGLIMAAMDRREKILIVAPSEKQAGIIMGDVIDHLFDNPLITAMMEYDPGSLTRLKQERSKKRITFRNDSEIFILTANVRELNRNADALMGFGATIVVADESSLIPDTMFSKILRMVGGFKTGKIIQLGNPFERNHFYRAFESHRYESISINYHQSLAEGRLTKEFLEEAKEDMTPLEFMVFYECEFPKDGAEDALIPFEKIMDAVSRKKVADGNEWSGLDVARYGRDKSVYAYRNGGNLKRLVQTQKMDTMELVGWTRDRIEEDEPEGISVDVIGIGAGVFDRLYELSGEGEVDCEVEEVNVGTRPIGADNQEKFLNLRAQIFWELGAMFRNDEISIPDDGELIKQLREIRYKYSSERKIKIEDKEAMKKRLGASPDKADAVAIAFFDVGMDEPDMYIA